VVRRARLRVARHPDFSADGAKGVLAVTGYEGVLGERINDRTAPDWSTTVRRTKALVARLRKTGWTFASHSYAHDDETKISVARLIHDSTEWRTQDEPIVGHTDVYVYPYGAGFPLSSPQIDVLRSFGFTILCDIDVVPRLTTGNGVTIMTRRHIDGVAFADQPAALAQFFNVSTVEDHVARASG
jgi:peptidoglycan/xylan/chitin deacetylase (PgdA/CDA1 family)